MYVSFLCFSSIASVASVFGVQSYYLIGQLFDCLCRFSSFVCPNL